MESTQQGERNLLYLTIVSLLLTLSSPAADIQIRLAGSTLCSGRVEIYYNNSWGTVCDDGWGIADAKVACRQLDCGPALSAPKSAHFGQGSGQIWLDNVDCSGHEQSLTECRHRGFGTHDCGHGEDAGVACSVSLPKPSISTHPAGVATWGQDVVITCLISPSTQQLLNATFILNQTSGSIRHSQDSQNNSATFRLLQVDFCHDGSYQCQYQITVSGQVYISLPSDSVTVDVRLQQPNISLTSPNRGLVWSPEGAEVTRGYSFVFTCSINSSYPDGRFFLIFSGSNFTDTKLAVNHSASFNFPAAEFEHQGHYSCVYEITMCSRKFTSAQAAQMSVVIKLPLFLLVSSVAAGILLLLLLVSVVVCLVVRRRQKAKQNETLVWSKHEDEDEDEDEEEKDYVNVEPMVTNSKQTEQAGGVEDEDSDEHDYEQVETNSKQTKQAGRMEDEYYNYDDYKEEEIDDIYVEASEDVNVEGNREEQVNDKDSTDDDDDYVNVTEPVIEQIVDIYGEYEDIYQNVSTC